MESPGEPTLSGASAVLSPETTGTPEPLHGSPAELGDLTLAPPFLRPSPTPYPQTTRFTIGYSAGGHEIGAWRFGEGARRIVLIGAIHGGYEVNTARLVELLVEHFLLNPQDVLPGVQLVLVPVFNPDGLEAGSGLAGRPNGNGVDLNRNWGCNWSDTAYLRDIPLNPGPRPFSEPETQALRAYFIAEPPEAVIFYHSQLGEIFVGACGEEHPAADWLGNLLEQATGYPYTDGVWYPVFGDAVDWLAERGIPAAEIELLTRDEPEFQRNLSGVMALQCHLIMTDADSGGAPPAGLLDRCSET